ncbi:MAG: hypothetical protein WD431_17565 [Cyclobacteriaceae bacterium]
MLKKTWKWLFYLPYLPIDQAENDISCMRVPYSGFEFFQSMVKGNNGLPCTDGIALRKTVFKKSGYFNENLIFVG